MISRCAHLSIFAEDIARCLMTLYLSPLCAATILSLRFLAAHRFTSAAAPFSYYIRRRHYFESPLSFICHGFDIYALGKTRKQPLITAFH